MWKEQEEDDDDDDDDNDNDEHSINESEADDSSSIRKMNLETKTTKSTKKLQLDSKPSRKHKAIKEKKQESGRAIVKRYMRPTEEAKSFLKHIPSMFRNPWEWYIKRTNAILRRHKTHQERLRVLYSTYSADKFEIEQELFRIKETKLELRYIVREVWLETGSEFERPVEQDDDEELFFCSVCKSKDADGEKGDIIICDHDMCGKAFHQACQVPVIVTSSSLYDPSKPFYCRRCRCFFALLNLINDEFGTDVNDWESLFPEVDEEFSNQASSSTQQSNNGNASARYGQDVIVVSSGLSSDYNNDHHHHHHYRHHLSLKKRENKFEEDESDDDDDDDDDASSVGEDNRKRAKLDSPYSAIHDPYLKFHQKNFDEGTANELFNQAAQSLQDLNRYY